MKNKITALFLSLFMIFQNLSCFALEDMSELKSEIFSTNEVLMDFTKENTPKTYCESAYVLNLENDVEIFEKSSTSKVYPTSTVKLMTAYTAYKLIPDLDTIITATESALKVSYGLNVKINSGESYTARDLFYAILVGGANDAANILAEYCAGSIEEFCKKMNEFATEMGAVDTNYVNPTGLHDDNMTTTAYDTALIAKNFYYINTLTEMSNTVTYEFSSINTPNKKITVKNRNRFLAYYYGKNYFRPNTLGLNSGSTDEGGNCLVTTSSKGGLTYLCVVMNCPEIPNHEDKKEDIITSYLDASALLDMCINSFTKSILLNKSKPIYELPVKNSATYDHVILYPYEEIELFLPKTLDLNNITFVPTIDNDYVLSPVLAGDCFGEVAVMYKGSVCLYKTPLVADTDIERSNILFILYSIENFLKSRWFLTIALIAVLLFVLYFILAIFVNIKISKQKYKNKRR